MPFLRHWTLNIQVKIVVSVQPIIPRDLPARKTNICNSFLFHLFLNNFRWLQNIEHCSEYYTTFSCCCDNNILWCFGTEKHFVVLLTKHYVCCNDIIKTLSCFVAAPAIFSCFVFVKTFFCLGHLCQMGFFVILSEQPICYCVTSATSPHLLVYVSPSEKCLILLPTVQRVLFAYCGGIHKYKWEVVHVLLLGNLTACCALKQLNYSHVLYT